MRRIVLFLVLLMSAAGCARVPTSGPVVPVEQPVTQEGSNTFVRALPRPPRPGMTTVELVQGFLDAASGFEDDHAVARMYLTARMAQRWRPDVGVRVYGNDTGTLVQDGPSSVRFDAQQVGRVSSERQYIPDPAGTSLTSGFQLEQVDGQWRIADVEQGLLLSRAAAERSYRVFRTYFVARPGGILTPNPVLFTSSVQDVAAELIRALLQGPSSWIEPTVLSAFPDQTQLKSLTITDGVASVDLSGPLQPLNELARQQLSAQVVWTLRQIAGIKAVIITVDGQILDVPGVEPVQPRTAWPEYNPDGLKPEASWYFQRQGAVLTVNKAGIPVPVAGAAGRGIPAITDPLIGLDLEAVAATNAAGQTLTSTIDSGTEWGTAPTTDRTAGGSWDRTGLLWLADGASGAQTVTVLGPTQIAVARRPVRSVQISRDGTRALVIAGPSRSAVAYVMRVEREGSPRLVRPRIIVSDPVRAGVWQAADRVALLVKPPGQPAQVAAVDLGLFSVQMLGGPPRARTLAAAPERPLLSGTADGRIWGFNGAIWSPQTTGSQPRYPG